MLINHSKHMQVSKSKNIARPIHPEKFLETH